MSNPVVARKDSSFLAVSLVPDVCKTPLGPSMVPVPYQVTADLEQSIETAPNVFANGKPIFLYGGSEVPAVTGNEAGTGGGMKSGVNGGAMRATEFCSSVKICGKHPVRHGDKCEMNVSRGD